MVGTEHPDGSAFLLCRLIAALVAVGLRTERQHLSRILGLAAKWPNPLAYFIYPGRARKPLPTQHPPCRHSGERASLIPPRYTPHSQPHPDTSGVTKTHLISFIYRIELSEIASLDVSHPSQQSTVVDLATRLYNQGWENHGGLGE